MVLVDAGKYNSSVSILDEAMGVSANSTLANYDSYLKKRWGLLSVGQGFDLKTKYYPLSPQLERLFNTHFLKNETILTNKTKNNI